MSNGRIIGKSKIPAMPQMSGIWNLQEQKASNDARLWNFGNPITNGLVLWVDFSDTSSYPGSGSVVNDLTKGGYNGTLINSPSFSSAASGSFLFNGSNQMISGTHSAELDISGNITVDCWFKISSNASDWVRVFGKGASNYRTYGLWYNTNSYQWLFQRFNSSGASANALVTDTSPLPLNTWINLVGTTSGSTHTLFLNGVQVATDGTSGPYAQSTNPYTFAYHGEIHTYHNGAIGEGRVYNRALSAQEVLNNYNSLRNRYGK